MVLKTNINTPPNSSFYIKHLATLIAQQDFACIPSVKGLVKIYLYFVQMLSVFVPDFSPVNSNDFYFFSTMHIIVHWSNETSRGLSY